MNMFFQISLFCRAHRSHTQTIESKSNSKGKYVVGLTASKKKVYGTIYKNVLFLKSLDRLLSNLI